MDSVSAINRRSRCVLMHLLPDATHVDVDPPFSGPCSDTEPLLPLKSTRGDSLPVDARYFRTLVSPIGQWSSAKSCRPRKTLFGRLFTLTTFCHCRITRHLRLCSAAGKTKVSHKGLVSQSNHRLHQAPWSPTGHKGAQRRRSERTARYRQVCSLVHLRLYPGRPTGFLVYIGGANVLPRANIILPI